MKHDRCRVFCRRRAEMVVDIRLFPNGAVFKSYYRTTLNAIKAAIDAANECIKLGSRGPVRFLGGLFSRFFDFLGRFGLRLLGRFLLSGLAIAFKPRVQMQQFVLTQFIQTRGLEFLRPHRFLNAPGRFFRCRLFRSALLGSR